AAVQVHEVRSAAALQHEHVGMMRGDGARLHCAGTITSPPIGAGSASCGKGRHQNRSSPSCSGHMLRRCGSTLSANSLVEYMHLSLGMSPTCKRRKILPTRSPLI